MKTVMLLHTNDFHNHLTDAGAEIIRKTRDSLPESLLLDAGDAISAGNIGVRPGGEPILELMSDLGYDAMTMGNREFHVADALLRAKIGRARFPILCANIRWRDPEGRALPVAAHLVKTLPNGLTVGVFGLTVPMVTPRMTARVVSAYVFDDSVTVARAQITELRSHVDVLIALTHIGLRDDERLASACPELDLIVGGHTHAVLEKPSLGSGVPIVQAGWFGKYLGQVTLEPKVAGSGARVTGHLIPLKG